VPTLIQLNTPFFFVFMLFALAMLTAFLFYRKSYPPIGVLRRVVLVVLRGLWMGALFFLLLSPVLKLHYSEQRPREVAVFVDHSGSMGLHNRFEKRADSLKQAGAVLEKLLSSAGVRQHWFSFSQSVRPRVGKDTLFSGLTNFTAVTRKVLEGGYDDLFIISDGIRTAGEIPVFSTVPAYAVGVGSTKIFPDIFIRRVSHDPEIIQNDTAHVRIVVGHKAIASRDVVVKMYRGNRLLRQEKRTLAADGGDVALEFAYVAAKPGFNEFRIEIQGAEEEQNLQNNRFSFTQWVRKSRLRIGLMAATPAYDFKFIHQAVAADKYLKPEIYIPHFKLSSSLPWDSLDAAFLIGLPAGLPTGAFGSRLDKWLAGSRVGRIFYLTDQSDVQKISRLPGVDWQIERQGGIGEGQITPQNPLPPLMSPFTQPEKNQAFWEKSAPVLSQFRIRAQNMAGTLNGDAGNVFLTLSEYKGTPFLLLNGYGLWRTAFDIQSSDPFMQTGYQRFIQGLAHRAAAKNRQKSLSLRADKHVYFSGESVILDAFVYDSRQKRVDNATVEVSAESEGQSYNFNLTPTVDGRYRAAFPVVNAGRYRFKALARRGETVLGEDKLTIRVQVPDAEFTHTRQDTAFLKKWAKNSGGAYLTLQELNQGKKIPGLSPVPVKHKIEIDLKNSLTLLIILLSLITLEWLLRKRFNLI